jgi:hypothetical protein
MDFRLGGGCGNNNPFATFIRRDAPSQKTPPPYCLLPLAYFYPYLCYFYYYHYCYRYCYYYYESKDQSKMQ